MEKTILFFIEYYPITWLFIPAVLIYKAVLFAHINDEPQVAPGNFIFFSHPNVATTHDGQLQEKKKFQNMLSWVIFGLIVIQLLLILPLLLGKGF